MTIEAIAATTAITAVPGCRRARTDVDMMTRKSAELYGTRAADMNSARSSIWIIPLSIFW
ncbi:hypothetical protein [Salinisphaera aquimarina]|uniref:Uncharacterized protein n=1 Tax=Salinisphaera aquimarina TaxID=2094031 RepID=A0ABV7EN16_9GAMM